MCIFNDLCSTCIFFNILVFDKNSSVKNKKIKYLKYQIYNNANN